MDGMTQLVPVKDWLWNLYQVRYLREEGGKAILVDWIVSTEAHMFGEAETRAPGDHCQWIELNCVKEDVCPPGVDWYRAGRREIDRIYLSGDDR